MIHSNHISEEPRMQALQGGLVDGLGVGGCVCHGAFVINSALIPRLGGKTQNLEPQGRPHADHWDPHSAVCQGSLG